MINTLFNLNKEISKTQYYFFILKFYSFLIYFVILYYLVNNNIRNKLILNLIKLGGPIFVKIGQNIANKNDLDDSLKQELIQLQENNYQNNKHNLSKFDLISPKPIAAGSVATVFMINHNNKPAILKILHPDIRNKIIMSINLFDNIRSYFGNTSWFSSFNQLVEFDQIYNEIINQSNLDNEVNNIQRFKENFKDFSDIVVFPEVFESNNEYIIESYEEGITFFDFIKQHPEKKDEASHLLHCCFYKMFFDNFIHADLHNSNIRFRINENDQVQIVFLDFGLVSEIESQDIYADFINIYKKNIFVPDYDKFIALLKRLNISKLGKLDEFEDKMNHYLSKLGIKNCIDSYNNSMNMNYEKKEGDELENIVSLIMSTALECNMKFNDYIFNICNGFILMEDYRFACHEEKSILHDRFDFAEEKGFVDNMKESATKILKKK